MNKKSRNKATLKQFVSQYKEFSWEEGTVIVVFENRLYPFNIGDLVSDTVLRILRNKKVVEHWCDDETMVIIVQ